MGGDDEPDEERIIEAIELNADDTVVVSSGMGEQFHRPNSITYDTNCKTNFKHPAETMTVSEAIQKGYTPCGKPGCFPDTDI